MRVRVGVAQLVGDAVQEQVPPLRLKIHRKVLEGRMVAILTT